MTAKTAISSSMSIPTIANLSRSTRRKSRVRLGGMAPSSAPGHGEAAAGVGAPPGSVNRPSPSD